MINMAKITPKSILNFNKTDESKKEITLDNLLEKSSTDNVSDAMKNLYKTTGVIENIKSISDNCEFIGPVVTCETNSDDWGTGIKAIYEAKEGDVLFIKCSDSDVAVWGELASTAAQNQGLKATIIYGASRDTEGIVELGYPVYSLEIRPNAGFAYTKGSINKDVVIDDMIISPGDILMGDRDGVVLIKKDDVDEVLEEVNNIKKFENNCIKEMKNKGLNEILNL